MASAFFRSRWAAVAFVAAGLITMFLIAPNVSPGMRMPVFLFGMLLWIASFPLYNYFSFKGLCQITEGKGVWATAWRSFINVIPTFGLYGFAVYDPLEEEDAQSRYSAERERRRTERAARRAALRGEQQ